MYSTDLGLVISAILTMTVFFGVFIWLPKVIIDFVKDVYHDWKK